MKKAILILILLGSVILSFAQQCLFERTYQKFPFGHSIRSYPAEMVTLGNGWLIAGYQGSCAQAYAMYIDCAGEVTWDYFAEAGYSIYTDLYQMDTLVYATGVDLRSDDVFGEEEYGFVDVFSAAGFQYRILTDSMFGGGFGSISADTSYIATTASINNLYGIGYDAPFYHEYDYVNIYNRSAILPAELSIAITNVGQALVIDSTIVAITSNHIKNFDINGTPLDSTPFAGTNSVAKIHQDSLLAVASRNIFLVLQSNLQIVDNANLAPVLEGVIDFAHHNNEWLILAHTNRGNTTLIARYSNSLSLIDSFTIDIGCATATELAVTDSAIMVVGYEKIDENYRIFAKTFSYTGAHFQPQGTLAVLSSSIHVDTILSSQAFPITPKIYYAQINAQLVVVNNTIDTVRSFCVYSDVVDFMNCSRNHLVQCYDSVDLASGDTVMLEWDYYQNITSGFNVTRNFWLVGVNDGLAKNTCDTFATVSIFFVGLNDLEHSAQSISAYPNPFSSKISLTNLPHDAFIGIFNLQGQELASISNTDVIDLTHISAGLYLYRIIGANGELIKTGKLVKE